MLMFSEKDKIQDSIYNNGCAHIRVYKYLHLSAYYLLTYQPLFERKEIIVK